MNGFRKSLLALVTVLTTSPVWAFSFFGLFGSNDDNAASLLQSIPADTAFVAIGQNNDPAASMWDGSGMNSWATSMPPLTDELQDVPVVNLFYWLVEDYMNTAIFNGYQGEFGYQAAIERYGIDEDGSSAIYLDGTFPVMRIMLDQPEAFSAVLDEAIASTGEQPEQRRLAGQDVQIWTISQDDATVKVDLGILVTDTMATITLINELDSDDRLAQRFGLAPQDTPLADSDAWASFENDYDFNNFTRGYVQFERLAEAFLSPQSNRMGQDLQRLAPQMMAQINAKTDAACSAEWIGVAQQTPRLVFGNESSDFRGDTLHQSAHMVLEINNSSVTSELSKLAGFVPEYSLDASDKLIAVALGLDVDSLAPVASTLWSQITSARFDCEQLADIQREIAELNPAMIGMVSGAAQGLKGVGLAVYDLHAEARSPMGFSGSFLVSLSANNPSLLANSLTASVPPLSGLRVAPNGEAITLPDLGLGQPIEVAIQGKHLVIYSGDAAEAAAEELGREALNTDGNLALSANYQRLGETMLALAQTPAVESLSQIDSGQNCTDLLVSWAQMSQMPMQLTYLDHYSERGWEAELDVSLSQIEDSLQISAGDYRTATLDYDCGWFSGATETLNADGSGHYRQLSDNGQCELYQIDYQWHQEGNRLIQETSAERSRNSCSDKWQEEEAMDYECTVVAANDTDFYCLYDFDGEATLMRYYR